MAPGRGANDDLDRQHDMPCSALRAAHQLDDQLGAFMAALVVLHPHRGQRRQQPVGERHVVVAGDRDVLRAAQPVPAQRRDGADREPVVGADDGGEALAARDQLLGATLALGLVERIGKDRVRPRLADPEQLAVQFERPVAPEAGRERLRPRDRGDLAMAARHQMRRECGGSRPPRHAPPRRSADRRWRARPSRPACPR